MDIQSVSDIIHQIAEGFEANASECLASQSAVIVTLIREQIKSGIGGDGKYLEPTYDNDPYFNERGYWYGRAADYKAWKKAITPPETSALLGLPPRPVEVPNLYIDGTFFGEINASMNDGALEVNPGNGNGPAIVGKYGERLFEIGTNAVEWFNARYMLPAIEELFTQCGYK